MLSIIVFPTTYKMSETGHRSTELTKFAEHQINYMLGDSGRSYEIGFGHDYPLRPHHRASSCRDPPALCGYDVGSHTAPEPNPHELTGALVGGPDLSDHFDDDRSNYESTEVTTDYNAGFQSCLARMALTYPGRRKKLYIN